MLVMSPNDPSLAGITRQLARLGVIPRMVSTVRESYSLLGSPDQPDAVISGVTLTDGNWCDLLAQTVLLGSEAKLFVCCPKADERLWSEVIWRGGHDILVEPYDLVHLGRTLGLRQASEEAGSAPQVASFQACA